MQLPYNAHPRTNHHSGHEIDKSSQISPAHLFLTTKEVSSRIGISVSTLEKWRRHLVNLPFYWIGSMYRYRLSDVLDFMEIHRYHCARTSHFRPPWPRELDDEDIDDGFEFG